MDNSTPRWFVYFKFNEESHTQEEERRDGGKERGREGGKVRRRGGGCLELGSIARY